MAGEEDLWFDRGPWSPPSDWFVPGEAADHAMAAISEGFCPRCTLPLMLFDGGREALGGGQRCPRCSLLWLVTPTTWQVTAVRGDGGVTVVAGYPRGAAFLRSQL